MFREYKKYNFFKAGETVKIANVWLGKELLSLVLEEDLARYYLEKKILLS